MKATRVMRVLVICFVLICSITVLNITVYTKQGVGGKVSSIKIPLYLKLLDFFDRHYNYETLVKKIVKDIKSDEGRLMEIFAWTRRNIRRVPEGFPIVDDHAWYIIIRGYGTDDQAQDVFSTLCNYVGLDAFFTGVKGQSPAEGKYLSFVKINGKWRLFDAYNGVYFKNNKGELADREDLAGGNWQAVSLFEGADQVNYQRFFHNLAGINYNAYKYARSSLQSPLRRLFFGTQKK